MDKQKIAKIIVAILCAIVAVVMIVNNTSSEGSKDYSQDESFWEGQVRPGTYSSYCYGWSHNPRRYEERTDVTFTIYDNKDIKIKYGTDVFYGTLHKYVETYDGERKVWYGAHAKQEGTTMVTDFNLSTELLYSPGDAGTYQEFSSRIKDCH